jgi:hypothetical protein
VLHVACVTLDAVNRLGHDPRPRRVQRGDHDGFLDVLLVCRRSHALVTLLPIRRSNDGSSTAVSSDPQPAVAWRNFLNWLTLARYVGNCATQLSVRRRVAKSLRVQADLRGGGGELRRLRRTHHPHCSERRLVNLFGVLVAAVGVGGIAAALQQAALFSLGAEFPAEGFNQGAVMGMSAAAALASIVKVVLKVAFGTGYDEERHDAIFYFSIDVVTAVMFFLFMRTQLVTNYFAREQQAPERPPLVSAAINRAAESSRDASTGLSQSLYAGEAIAQPKDGVGPSLVGPVDHTSDASLVSVFQAIPWLLLANFANFFATGCVYPGVLVAANPNDSWFQLQAVLAMNVALFLGRLAEKTILTYAGNTKITAILSNRHVIVATLGLRWVIFVPLLVFVFPGREPNTAVYVTSVVFQFVGGSFTAFLTVAIPRCPVLADNPTAKRLAGQVKPLSGLVASVLKAGANLICADEWLRHDFGSFSKSTTHNYYRMARAGL